MTWVDGTSWIFADPGANAIGFVTNAGGFTYYPVPTAGAQPTEITPNSNGHWWFTEPGISKIGSIDIGGHITEYASPGKPAAIVAAPNDIFVLTSTGNIKDYDPGSGQLRHTYVPPSSSNGPAVGIFAADYATLMVLRSDGTNGLIQIVLLRVTSDRIEPSENRIYVEH